MRRSSPLPWLLALAVTLTALLPVRPAGAVYYMQFAFLLAGDGVTSHQVADGDTIDRFTTEFQFGFSDQLDPASVPGNVTVTDGDGHQLNWRTDTAGADINLHPLFPLSPSAPYRLLIHGGPTGVKNADGATLQSDISFHLTTDDLPFRFEQLAAIGAPLDGETLPRNAAGVQLLFSHPVQAETAAPAIHVTKHDGTDAGWTVANVQGRAVTLAFPGRLPMADERYTVTVGATLLDVLGQPLPAPLQPTLHTLNLPYRFTAAFDTNWHRFSVTQSDHFRFQARSGQLDIGLGAGAQPVTVRVVLVDEQQNRTLSDQKIAVNQSASLSPALTHDGPYGLYIYGNKLERITVTGLELDFPTATPALNMPPIPAYATANDPFSFAPELENPTETERVAVYIGDTLLSQNAMGPDGRLQPVTVDTRALPDNIYAVTAIGKALGSDNTGFSWVTILVDREDAFPDVPKSHWAHRYVEVMHHMGIINGVDSGGYAPGNPVTRAEYAKLLTLTLGLAPAAPGTSNPFVDIDGHWATPYILALYQAGLVTGDIQDGKRYFHPQDTLDRAQAATMLGRALGVSNQPVNGQPFPDWDQVPDWARSSVAALTQMGWVSGYPDGAFHPADQLNRDQAAKLLAKFFGM